MKSTKTNDILNYGQMVHEKRSAINMTEEKLAELTDRSDKEIRNIESGASIPKLDTVVRISNRFVCLGTPFAKGVPFLPQNFFLCQILFYTKYINKFRISIKRSKTNQWNI